MRITANLSRFHPDYGKSPAEHEKLKADRAAGKAKFIPKDEIRNKALFGKKRGR